MQVSLVNGFQERLGFKSAVPVFVKVATDSQTFMPVISGELNDKFMRKTEYLLNNSLRRGVNKERDALADRFRGFFKKWVPDFYGKVMAFTCVDGGAEKGELKPYFYFLTGETSVLLEKLRNAHKEAVIKSEGYNTAELKIAKDNYYNQGKNLVQKAFLNYRPLGRDPYAMVASYEPVRKKNGEIKDYKLVNVEFKPVEDAKSPTINLDKLA